MAVTFSANDIRLPGTWPRNVKSAILHVIALARLAIVRTRDWTANSCNARLRLRAELEQARAEIALLQEELRIKDARMGRLDPSRRPHYRSVERLAILELKAARGWSAAQTSRRFLVLAVTIASWLRRVDERGASALVDTGEPVNKFPEFVRYIVRRLKVLCPSMGKKRTAQTLARAGLHLGVTTVGRMLKEDEAHRPAESSVADGDGKWRTYKPVTSKYPNHVWLVDLTVAPTSVGFWAPWLPHAVPALWPFCWWIACAVDHYSRRVMGFALFSKEPASIDVRRFLGRAIGSVGIAPKYFVSDKGGQFWCPSFKAWCKRRNVQPRYAAAGQRGATAVIERFFKSLKEEWLRGIQVPLRREAMRQRVSLYLSWHHDNRPHQGLGGRTPSEVYEGRRSAGTRARFEPRASWPTDSPCARPQANPKRRQPSRLAIVVRFKGGSRHLPIVELMRAA